MAEIDIYSHTADAHRVRPLLRFLELQGLTLTTRSPAQEPTSDPFLVIVSPSNAEAPETQRLLKHRQAVAIRLADLPLPAGIREIDLTQWPARSTDRTLAALAEWITLPDQPEPFRTRASTSAKKNQDPQAMGARVALALIGIGMLALFYLPESGDPGEERGPVETAAGVSRTTAGPMDTSAPLERNAPQVSRIAAVREYDKAAHVSGYSANSGDGFAGGAIVDGSIARSLNPMLPLIDGATHTADITLSVFVTAHRRRTSAADPLPQLTPEQRRYECSSHWATVGGFDVSDCWPRLHPT